MSNRRSPGRGQADAPTLLRAIDVFRVSVVRISAAREREEGIRLAQTRSTAIRALSCLYVLNFHEMRHLGNHAVADVEIVQEAHFHGGADRERAVSSFE